MHPSGPSSQAEHNGEFSVARLPRMEFALPEFQRCVWVSDGARASWEPRIKRITDAWREIEWRTVAEGVRPCVTCWISTDGWQKLRDRSKKSGLAVEPLMVKRAPKEGGPSGLLMRAVIGRRRDAKRFARAWANGAYAETGALLGYPECCCRFFAETVRDPEQREMLWTIAARSCSQANEHQTLVVEGPWELNIFWGHLGVRAVPHLPCRMQCAESLELGSQFASVGNIAGYADEMAWTREILQWPLEWSVLHGIAEMKTPILKLCANSVATPMRFTIRRLGSSYPEDGAQGVDFPFQQPDAVRAERFTEGLNIIYGTGQRA